MKRSPVVPEDSVAIRVVVLALVEVAILAVVAQGAVGPFTAAAAVALAPVGYAYSYVNRRRPSVAAKIALALGLLVALASFVQAAQEARSFDDARVPLASLFLWVQVLHAFDVPRRRDLAFSAISSLILIAEAGALSLGTGFLLFLVPWSALAAVYLFLSLRPVPAGVSRVAAVRRPVSARPAPAGPALARTLAAWTAIAGVSVAVVFLALPRFPGVNVALPPFSAQDATAVSDFRGQVANPGVEVGPDGIPDFRDLAYPGFGSDVDLRSRGRLSDEVVMRVRSPQAALWRGEAFDTYNGTTWTASDERTVPATGEFGAGIEVPGAPEGELAVSDWQLGVADWQTVVTTFYVAADLPNLAFAAAVPSTVYFPSSSVSVDRYGSIRTPILLEEGVVYSVVSDIRVTPPELLRAEPVGWDASVLARYTQLPVALPPRTAELAERITAGAPTIYDRVRAVEAWLQRNTEYDLAIPADPPGVDAVDHFLFETRRGFCEHIASAMVILLRSVGVPARLVTGFGPGDRNTFTGYYDVRASDAHAWVEVLYPNAGWVQYDPTFGVPPADPGFSGRFIAPEVLRAIGGFLGAAVPQPVRDAARAAAGGISAAAGWFARAWPVAVLVLAGAGAAIILLRARGARARHGPPPVGVARAFAELSTAMASRGHPRRDAQTPAEFLRSLRPYLEPRDRSDAELIVRLFERDRFSEVPVTATEEDDALVAAERLTAQGSRKRIMAASHTRS